MKKKSQISSCRQTFYHGLFITADLEMPALFFLMEVMITSYCKLWINWIRVNTKFTIWQLVNNNIKDFLDIRNSCHKYMRFTFITSHSDVSVLDTTMYKGTVFSNSQRLDIRSFIKPIYSFQYLHKVFIVGQFQGFNRSRKY